MEELILGLEQETQNYGFYAFNILKNQVKDLFKKNIALSCLAKSDSFLKELLDVFNKLYFCDILPDTFYQIVQSVDISNIDKERLLICAKVYKSYLDIMIANNYDIPSCKGVFCGENLTEDFIKSVFSTKDNYECLEFDDVQSECLYLAEQVKKLVQSGTEYKEIAIFADKLQMRQKILDILKAQEIPVVANIYHQEYENLKYKINLFYQMGEILKGLGFEEFSSNAFKNAINIPKAQKEIKFEELDELIKTLLIEITNDNRALDKILFKKDNSTKTLLEILFANLDCFSEIDRDTINKEFGLFKHFYEFYFNNNYYEAIKLLINSKISKFEEAEIKATVIRKLKSLEQLQSLYDDILHSQPEFDAFIDIMMWLGRDKSNQNALTLESIASNIVNKKTFKYVFVLGLTENNFPGNNASYSFVSEQTNYILSKAIKELKPDFDWFIKNDDVFYSQKLLQIYDVMKCGQERIVLSTHSYESKKQVQPSVVFQLASENNQKYTKISNILEESISENFGNLVMELQKTNIINEDDILKLNPSAINTFQTCPRKYYYKHLLNLKEPYTFSANYGSIVHAVFEVLNRRFLPENRFTKEVALELGNVLFDSKNNPENAIKAGFKQIDVDLINETAELSLVEMKDLFVDAIEDFALSGGFDNLFKSAVCEKAFSFSIPELPNVIFDGRIDAIIENSDGTFSIIDYKTGHDKINTLEYAISEYGLNFLSRTGKEPANIKTLQKAYDYQIPIYYLATQYADELSEFKDKISELGLVYIRPKSKDNGCKEDLIDVDKMVLYKDKIIQNLKETVIDKIVKATEFEKQNGFFCENCAYKFLCDSEDCDD